MSSIIDWRNSGISPVINTVNNYNFDTITVIKKIEKDFFCDTSLTEGDTVYISLSDDNFVIKNVNNTDIVPPTIGVVTEKTSLTTCKVLMSGECNLIFSGLSTGKIIFLSTSGGLTTTAPTTGFIQEIGICYENNKAYINPSYVRTKKH